MQPFISKVLASTTSKKIYMYSIKLMLLTSSIFMHIRNTETYKSDSHSKVLNVYMRCYCPIPKSVCPSKRYCPTPCPIKVTWSDWYVTTPVLLYMSSQGVIITTFYLTIVQSYNYCFYILLSSTAKFTLPFIF